MADTRLLAIGVVVLCMVVGPFLILHGRVLDSVVCAFVLIVNVVYIVRPGSS